MPVVVVTLPHAKIGGFRAEGEAGKVRGSDSRVSQTRVVCLAHGSETWQSDSGDCGMFRRFHDTAVVVRDVITFSHAARTSRGGSHVLCRAGGRA
ncbi:hypothetical protein AAFF_G00016850 [Aldrovandia affinis]|uniref:Uncharacterized protein n=1 Tax=Aldrovandia affinis TaxID=143900 RepID=A0AAD7S626_9TELE|nr:hypothetical protein AAFF_G00016850 [Aldrovandia affinis]